MLGPAFIAAVAYVDPGNVATNTTAGAKYQYLLVWVLVWANVLGFLVQFLSAKLGLFTGRSLPQLLGTRLRRHQRLAYWLQAEVVTMATDLAEIIGGALALNLLFGLPLLVGATVTVAVSFLLLLVNDRRGQRAFERTISGLLLVIAVGFLAGLMINHPSPPDIGAGLIPGFEGTDSVVLAAGMVGATVMPHAIYLHSALAANRYGDVTAADARPLVRSLRIDVGLAMLIAGGVNVGMLLLAASSLAGLPGVDTLEGAHAAITRHVGSAAGLLFAIALLTSGLASTAVGSQSGAIVMEGLLRRRVSLLVRRLVTAVPTLTVLVLGIDPTAALIVSQVVLSFGIPFALVPLIRLTSRRQLMGPGVIGRATLCVAWVAASIVIALNIALVVLTLA